MRHSGKCESFCLARTRRPLRSGVFIVIIFTTINMKKSDFVFSWLGAWRSYHWGRSPYDRFPFQPFDMYTGRFRRTPNKDRHQDTAYCGCRVSALLLGERGWDVAQTNCSFFTTFHKVICAHAAQHQPHQQKGAQMYSLRSHHDSSEPIHNSECTPHLFFLLYCTTLTYFSATP